MTWRVGNYSYFENTCFHFLPEFYTTFIYTKDNLMNEQVDQITIDPTTPTTADPSTKVFVQTDKETSVETTENVVPQ